MITFIQLPNYLKIKINGFDKENLSKSTNFKKRILTLNNVRMKKRYIFSIFLMIAFASTLFSQTEPNCGTSGETNPLIDQCGYSQSVDPVIIENSDVKVYNIFFWGIRHTNGSGNTGFDEQKVLTAVANLNIAFNQYKIFFKYYGMDFIDDSSIYDPAGLGEIMDVADPNYVKSNAFNVYVPQGYSTNYWGYGYYHSKLSTIMTPALTSYGIVHEIGHNFSAYHTSLNYTGANQPCERVTRDPTNSNYNAHEAGDFITDTAASPPLFSGVSQCAYTGGGTDCEGDPYQIFPEDVANFMSRANYTRDCIDRFAMGQGIRMRETIDCWPGVYTLAQVDIAALYEPYKGSYPAYYPHPQPWQLPLFQPGFEYHFVDCCCEYVQPAPYGDMTFNYDVTNIVSLIQPTETNYQSIFHPNHSAIKIVEVDDALGTPLVERCYDNYVSPPVIGGSVTKFNDDVINTNITVTPQDSTGINSPTLIDDLQQGLYKIEKNIIDGSTEETVIYKVNN